MKLGSHVADDEIADVLHSYRVVRGDSALAGMAPVQAVGFNGVKHKDFLAGLLSGWL